MISRPDAASPLHQHHSHIQQICSTPPALPGSSPNIRESATPKTPVYIVLDDPTLSLQTLVLTGTSVSNMGLSCLSALPYLHTFELCDSGQSLLFVCIFTHAHAYVIVIVSRFSEQWCVFTCMLPLSLSLSLTHTHTHVLILYAAHADRIGNAGITSIAECGGLVSLILHRLPKISNGIQVCHLVFICICMCVCIYIYTHTQTHTHTHIHTYCIVVCVYVFMHTVIHCTFFGLAFLISVHVFVCMCSCTTRKINTCACMYICAYMYVYIYVCICIYIYIYTHTSLSRA